MTYNNFVQVFFSKEFTQYLEIKDIPVYRRICKKARNTKIYMYYTIHHLIILVCNSKKKSQI